MHRLIAWLIIAPTMVLGACANPPVAPEIRVENAVVRLPVPGQTTAVAYFDIVNQGGPDQLISVRTAISSNSELHTHLHEDGIMKMRRIELVDVLATATTSFEPGGNHVMIFDANIPASADLIPLTLRFVKSGDLQIEARVTD